MSVFKGAAVAIITPFHDDADKTINYDVFADLIDYQIEHGTDAIVVCGSTGEAATMTEEEHLAACRFVIDYVKKRVPVIAGTGSNCTRTAIELSREVAGYGADALLLVTPYYNKGTQEGMYRHFRTVAQEVPGTDIILYNVPSRTGGNILPATVARLVRDVPNITGIKEASGNISQIVELMTDTDGKIELYSGNDDQVVPLMSMGGLGVISVVSNIAPQAMHASCPVTIPGVPSFTGASMSIPIPFGHTAAQAPQPMQRSSLTAGTRGLRRSFSSRRTIWIAPTGQWRAQLPHLTSSVRIRQFFLTHTACPICVLDFSSGVIGRMAPAGHTSEQRLHSGRQ